MGIFRALARGLARAAGKVLQPKRGNGADISKCAVRTVDGGLVELRDQYSGKVLLIVNVASKCGLTPQYAALQELHERFRDRGFAVLGFPCNDFGAQEPGTNEEIREFCSVNFKVGFDLFDKVRVSGAETALLYCALTGEANSNLGGPIKWNFTKFLVGRDGRVKARIEPPTPPDAPAVLRLIEDALDIEKRQAPSIRPGQIKK